MHMQTVGAGKLKLNRWLTKIKDKLIHCHRDAFQVNDDTSDVRKSVGIDKEGGLVFALDTMQVIAWIIHKIKMTHLISL